MCHFAQHTIDEGVSHKCTAVFTPTVPSYSISLPLSLPHFCHYQEIAEVFGGGRHDSCSVKTSALHILVTRITTE